ncbi:hypothetical protein ACWERV_29855 [Streptomyces sp. NPDC004031]
MDEQLSRALRLYYAEGLYPTRYRDAAALSETFGEPAVADLLRRIDHVAAEAFDLGRRYDRLALRPAMRAVTADLRRAHPELSEQALAAVGLYWGYCNR